MPTRQPPTAPSSGPAQRLDARGIDTQHLRGLSFTCLEGCGFCCTFTPEVGHDELARLRRRFPALPVARTGDAMTLAFQGGCGACTLLHRRQCSAYEDRPAHCRYFPFHVYFGRRVEAYANRSCRGVEPAPSGDLETAFLASVQAPAHAIAERTRQAARVHAEFARRVAATDRGHASPGVDEAAAAALAEPASVLALGRALWADAWAPFADDDVVARPFYLAADLQWNTWHAEAGRIQRFTMEEDGSLHAHGSAVALAEPPAAGLPARWIVPVLRRLVQRDVFAGQVFDLVDDSAYEVDVRDAAVLRLAQMAADLGVRVPLLQALGIPDEAMVEELDRFYDAAFLDAPTIGGWL